MYGKVKSALRSAKTRWQAIAEALARIA